MNIEIIRTENGMFDVMVNGAKTDWEIVNGSLGSSGCGRNDYYVHKAGVTKINGVSLQRAKKQVKFWIEKEEKEAKKIAELVAMFDAGLIPSIEEQDKEDLLGWEPMTGEELEAEEKEEQERIRAYWASK